MKPVLAASTAPNNAVDPAIAADAQASSLLPPLVPPGAKYNLTDCQRLLAQTYGEAAPAMLTLRRHARAGMLKEFAVSDGGKRPLYLWEQIRRRYEPSAAPVPRSVRPAGGGAPGQGGYTDEQLQRVLAAALAPVLREITALTRAVSELPAVRNALMAKYDAAASLALARADDAAAQARQIRGMLDVDSNLVKLTAAVNRLTQAVEGRKAD